MDGAFRDMTQEMSATLRAKISTHFLYSKTNADFKLPASVKSTNGYSIILYVYNVHTCMYVP